MKDEEWRAEQLAALEDAVRLLGELNKNVHFYTDFLTQEYRNTLKKIWMETIHRVNVLLNERRDGEDKASV